MSDTYTTETIQRRPEYIERLEKALLEGIFGVEDTSSGAFQGGLLQDPNLFAVAPYKLAGQQGRAEPIRYDDVLDEAGNVVGQ
ncbi:MAG: hypothetical protein ACPHQD_16310, partial [Vibrio toranzoniae]|uniref:hypothetical protein n=1 Tax=Vibrio toranzoniae TaxID=1194427 RepID=UPI003C45FCF3